MRRALELIMEGFPQPCAIISDLADRLGVGERYLRKLFQQKVGVSPTAVAQTQRLHLAQKLVLETDLPMTQVAFAAGFSSLRRFNSATRRHSAAHPANCAVLHARFPAVASPCPCHFAPIRLGGRARPVFTSRGSGVGRCLGQHLDTRPAHTQGAALVTIGQGGDDHLLAQLQLATIGS